MKSYRATTFPGPHIWFRLSPTRSPEHGGRREDAKAAVYTASSGHDSFKCVVIPVYHSGSALRRIHDTLLQEDTEWRAKRSGGTAA
ncbi:hypothetical protein OE88DRAFT_1653350 [Heliocybe sulcata]|uniref:Uncharacterized protein n=1 Tax=Heliocybe sulcata TaxID=5364 RepID=A0A5C3NBZ5_9AGAM|nr:hypothetical protein OE88DRAFT_1653350 [Heliocybe sulcata]